MISARPTSPQMSTSSFPIGAETNLPSDLRCPERDELLDLRFIGSVGRCEADALLFAGAENGRGKFKAWAKSEKSPVHDAAIAAFSWRSRYQFDAMALSRSDHSTTGERASRISGLFGEVKRAISQFNALAASM
jgi:hypothetical protein